jgi:hypothetical protein
MAGPEGPELPGEGEKQPVDLPGAPGETQVARPEVDRVLPATGQEPRVVLETDIAGASVINYYFPVQVEVIGQLDETQMKAVADYVFDQLNAELRRRE